MKSKGHGNKIVYIFHPRLMDLGASFCFLEVHVGELYLLLLNRKGVSQGL